MSAVEPTRPELLSIEDAERRSERIGLDLDATAERFESAMERMRAAIRDRDDLALGYRSPGDYLSDRFGGKLARLGVDLRREVVRELTESGLSTRAIAPIVGANQATVVRDLRRDADASPDEPDELHADDLRRKFPSITTPLADPPPPFDPATGEVLDTPALSDDPDRIVKLTGAGSASSPGPITGMDGKTYTRPEPAPKPRRKPITDSARDAGWELRKATERIQRLTEDDRFSTNKEQVTTHLRGHLSFVIEVCQDLLDQLNQSQED